MIVLYALWNFVMKGQRLTQNFLLLLNDKYIYVLRVQYTVPLKLVIRLPFADNPS